MDLQTLTGLTLVTLVLFGATASFDKDGMNIIRIGEDTDAITFAVQQLVNAGFTVKEAMRQLDPNGFPRAQCLKSFSDIRAELPEIVH